MASNGSKPSPAKPIEFRFDELAATEAAALLIELHGGRIEKMRLMKLLYFAERESLKRNNRTICGDRFASMDHGPVLRETLNLAREQSAFSVWGQFIKEESKFVSLVSAPPPSELPDADRAILREIELRYRETSTPALRSLSHDLPEYQDPQGSSLPILIEEVLRALNKTASEMEDVRRSAELSKIDIQIRRALGQKR